MRSPRNAERGNTLVEVTLLLSLLVAFFIGLSQFGYAFYIYNELEHATRLGARYASVRLYDSGNSTPSSAFQTAVQNVVVYASPAPDDDAKPVVPNLARGNVSLTVTFNSGVPTMVNVGINNYALPGFFGTVTLNNKPSTQFPYVGIFGPP